MFTCAECAVEKQPDSFYRQPNAKRGHAHICKDCHKMRMRVRARTNPCVQEYDRKRAKAPHRVKMAREITKEWREKNPLAYKAHSAVSNAIRDGKLTRLNCEFCDSPQTHGHHKDYSKPLDVVWLCAKCHHRLHALFPALEGANKSEAA